MHKKSLKQRIPGAAADYSSMILCLLDFEIPRKEIALLFGTTVSNIGKIYERRNKTITLACPPSLAESLTLLKTNSDDWKAEHEAYEKSNPSRHNRRIAQLYNFLDFFKFVQNLQEVGQFARNLIQAADEKTKQQLSNLTPWLDALEIYEKDFKQPLEPMMATLDLYRFVASQTDKELEWLVLRSDYFKKLALKLNISVEKLFADLIALLQTLISKSANTPYELPHTSIRQWQLMFALRRLRKRAEASIPTLLDAHDVLAHFKFFRMCSTKGDNWKTLFMKAYAKLLVAQQEYVIGDYREAYKLALEAMESAKDGFNDSCGNDEFLHEYVRAGSTAMSAAMRLNRPDMGLSICLELEPALPYCEPGGKLIVFTIKTQLLMKCGKDAEALKTIIEAQKHARSMPTSTEVSSELLEMNRLINVLHLRRKEAIRSLNKLFTRQRQTVLPLVNAVCDIFDIAFATDNEKDQQEAIDVLEEVYSRVSDNFPIGSIGTRRSRR